VKDCCPQDAAIGNCDKKAILEKICLSTKRCANVSLSNNYKFDSQNSPLDTPDVNRDAYVHGLKKRKSTMQYAINPHIES
jgi:hypothetical protein